MVQAVLSPPVLPQMSNDGFINAAEMNSASGVVIQVNHYTEPAVGDYLCLYWDNQVCTTLLLTVGNIDSAFPWQVIIPEALVPNGTHEVFYTATDTYQNIAASGIATAIVDRNHTGTLEPPTFPDAVANIIDYQSITFNNGTHIAIPVNPTDITPGDTVNIFWEGFDADGQVVQDSMFSTSHTVTEADMSGFTVLVPPSHISVINEGTAMSWYSVLKTSGDPENSESAVVNIDMTYSGAYPAPVIPSANDGWLDCAECMNGVDIIVLPSTMFSVGGTVAVYWQGYDTNGSPVSGAKVTLSHTLVSADITNGFTVTVDPSFITPIGIGIAQASYQVMSPATPGYSALTQVNVDTQHCSLLPAPLFPSATDDNIISGDEVSADDGTDMNVSYPDMVAGDVVTAFWFGFLSSSDEPLPGTSWTETRTVTVHEEQVQEKLFHIPASYINPIDNGYGEGRYQVMFKNGGISSSAITDVAVELDTSSTLQIICGTGAPVFNPIVPVRPVNKITLSGPAGSSVNLTLPLGSQAFFDPSGERSVTVILDTDGRGTASVYAFAVGNATIKAYVSDDPALSATSNMAFTDWTPGKGDLVCYGISSGAAADGTGTCGVYMQTAEGSTATQARLVLTGSTSAFLPVSGTQTAYADVSITHACGFDVADLTAEKVPFTLSLPDVSQAYVTGELSFLDFN